MCGADVTSDSLFAMRRINLSRLLVAKRSVSSADSLAIKELADGEALTGE
jgi:hypothetical protein